MGDLFIFVVNLNKTVAPPFVGGQTKNVRNTCLPAGRYAGATYVLREMRARNIARSPESDRGWYIVSVEFEPSIPIPLPF